MQEPLSPADATALIKSIYCHGHVAWSQHATNEMANDALTAVDCEAVLRAGNVYDPPDLERGTWRYRMETNKIAIVVGFRSEDELVVITAWKKRTR